MGRKTHVTLTATYYHDSDTIGWIGSELRADGTYEMTSGGLAQPFFGLSEIVSWLVQLTGPEVVGGHGPTVGSPSL